MQIVPSNVLRMLKLLRTKSGQVDLGERLRTGGLGEASTQIRPRHKASADSIARIWQRLRETSDATAEDEAELTGSAGSLKPEIYSKNIENLIGAVRVPVGVVGPMRVNGVHANGDFFVPLATTEAALVASYGRGADVCSKSGGISAAMVSEGLLRTPAFIFAGIHEAGLFINWIAENSAALKTASEATTRYGKLISIEPVLDSDTVFLMCRYTTGDASGQNMVTVATEAICAAIEESCPVKPLHWFIEANFSGDKKASYLGLLTGRGRRVTASVTIPNELIARRLHVEPEKMLAYGRIANLGAILSGQLGAQAHYSNALAALYIATGQDAACVSESAVGFTRMERRDDGLFFSVTLPNILVGTVGGGTSLPGQSAGLRIMGLKGENKAAALAEVAAAICLCGEVSIIGAIASGRFTRAHKKLARDR